MPVIEKKNTHLFMITTHGNAGDLKDQQITEALTYITDTVNDDNTSKIFIGFDGDGAYGKLEWPTPSSTAVRIIDGLIKLDYKNVVLVQSQVYDYCAIPYDYSKKVPGLFERQELFEGQGFYPSFNQIQIMFHPYKTNNDTHTQEDAEENVTSVPFYTIAYNKKEGEEDEEEAKRKEKIDKLEKEGKPSDAEAVKNATKRIDVIDEFVEVEYGMRGEKGEKLLYGMRGKKGEKLPKEFNELGLTNLNDLGPNNVDVAFLNVDLYGGTSHVKEGLKQDGEPAGSTAAWLASKLLTDKIPKENIHLIALWDRCIEGNKQYELSITRRTVELMTDRRYKVKVLQKEYNTPELDKCKSLKENMNELNRARFGKLGGGRRKSKKKKKKEPEEQTELGNLVS